VEFGAHLPLIDFGTRTSLAGLKAYARNAAALGYRYLCANDHLLFSRPWLDGPTALAAVIEESHDMTLATTVSLPVISSQRRLPQSTSCRTVASWSAWARDRRPGTTGRPVSRSTSGGHASPRPSSPWAPCSHATRPSRRVLLVAWDRSRAAAGAKAETADLGRKLGLTGRPSAGRAAWRRLACVRLQHNA
jgi:hypothetical protein